MSLSQSTQLLLAISLVYGCNATTEQSLEKPEQKSQVQLDKTPDFESQIESLLAQMTLDEKLGLVHADSKFSIGAVERLGIHEMVLSDGPHGVRYEINRHDWAPANLESDHSTYLPPLTTVAASWDVEMATLHGNVLGSEARHRGKDFILGPGVNMARLPLYGRNFEYMGEDPYLAAKLVVPEVKAIQQNDVAATVKHYALNTQELNRTGVDARPSERTLREVYLPAFEAAVKEGGAWALMGAYNNYYGTNANQSKHLVMDILKGEWGFEGVLMTDWNVNINTFDAAVNGLDIEMGTDVKNYNDYVLADNFKKMIVNGDIESSVLDDKVRRILRVQFNIGMMDKSRKSGQRNTQEHKVAARTIAENGVVLLKNDDNVLPLDPTQIKSILVMGPNADKAHGAGGGSSEIKSLYEITPLQGLKNALGNDVEITFLRAQPDDISPIPADFIATRHWTGTPAWNISFYQGRRYKTKTSESWIVNSEYKNSDGAKKYIKMSATIKPLRSGEHILQAEFGGEFALYVDGRRMISDSRRPVSMNLMAGKAYDFEIEYQGKNNFVLGWQSPGGLFLEKEQYLAAAKKADAIIYFGGLSHADDREAIDRTDMKLPNGQDQIISNLLSVNANTTVVMVAGSAVEMPWVEQAKSVVWGWYGGQEAGNALANVLLGKVNPSGKMPITLPKQLSDVAAIKLDDYNATESLYKEGVFIGYRWFEQQQIDTLFPFGHGLSYTTFDYQNLMITPLSDGNVKLTLDVKNTGLVKGKEVVQLYVHDVESSVERPLKELKGFTKVELNPGETQQVTLTLKPRDLSFWDESTNAWRYEAGEFEAFIGSSLADLRLNQRFVYQ